MNTGGIERTEKVLLHYLRRAPLSFSLWRSLEYQQLENIPFPAPILDMGCGDGVFFHILPAGRADVGMDLSRRELTLARRADTHRALAAADARALPFKDSSFSTVFSNCVLEHIPGAAGAIREAARALKPGGVLIFTVPSEHFTPNLLFGSAPRRLGLGFLSGLYGGMVNRLLNHRNMFPLKEWERLAGEAGLKVETSRLFVSPRAVAVFGFFLPLSFFSLLNRRLLGRWVVFPFVRKLMAALVFAWAKRRLRDDAGAGGCVLIAARKPGGGN